MEDLLDHFLDRQQTDSTFTENELNGNFAMNEPLEMSSDSDDSDDSNATEIEEGEVEGKRPFQCFVIFSALTFLCIFCLSSGRKRR